MKRVVVILGFAYLLNGCATQADVVSQAAEAAGGCPKPKVVSLPKTTSQEEGFYNRFDYHIRNIVADANTVKFQAQKYNFVFCRGNSSWTVEPGTLPSSLAPKNYAEAQKDLINPPLKTINFKGKTYHYRVFLSPNPFATASQPRREPNQVVFELISDKGKRKQRQTLYTLKKLQEAKVGSSLGVPRVTAATIHGGSLWWTVASEQGEGASGIATLVNYNPQAGKLTLIQPEKIKGQQITDLAITGDAANPTLWMATRLSGEGNAYLPGLGLVAYRPHFKYPNAGEVKSYNIHNTPLVGAIPDKVKIENDTLWVGTGNGVCKLKWQAADNPKNWSCWRFALMTKLPSQGLPLYSALTNKTPAVKLDPGSSGETIEVLWWMPVDNESRKGRYEVRYPQGFTATLNGQGAEFLPQETVQIRRKLEAGTPPFYWAGQAWHWRGDRFVRGFDEVAENLSGGGPRGIGPDTIPPNGRINSNAVRGDLDLLNLTKNSTRVRYRSAWVDEAKIDPYLTVLPQERPQNPQPNPLEAIAKKLQSR